jgi:aspartate/methionine/tyrosine aminotransferase
MIYDRPPLPDPTSFSEKVISMGTLSKCFGLPGLRVGWCIAAPEVLERCIRWRDYITLHLSPLVETIAAAAISRAEVLIAPRLEQARSNLEILSAWLAERADDFAWVPPRGGVCIFPRFLPEVDVDAFCHRLAQEKKVLLVPGSCFSHPRHVRLGFGGSAASLREGLGRVGELLDAR